MSKITVKAPANIAFIKYWGRSEHELYIPRNNSISMNLSNCYTITSVEFGEQNEDIVEVKYFEKEVSLLTPNDLKSKALFRQIERIRQESGIDKKVKIYSENSFPADAGIASSASSFAALTGALLILFGQKEKFEDKIEFSRQIRLCGSGSAIRSSMDGFVEFLTPKESILAKGGFEQKDLTPKFSQYLHQGSKAKQIADQNHWDLVDIVAIVDPQKKLVSSSKGHLIADTSPYFETRILEMQNRIDLTRKAILDKDFKTLGRCIEEDSTSMHAIMMTSNPPVFYWGAGSIQIMLEVMKWRREDGLLAYFTLDAGPNVHIICQKKDTQEIQKKLKAISFVKWTIYNEVSAGAHIV